MSIRIPQMSKRPLQFCYLNYLTRNRMASSNIKMFPAGFISFCSDKDSGARDLSVICISTGFLR